MAIASKKAHKDLTEGNILTQIVLFALPLIALYNQKRGKIKMKSFFYIYYPLHMTVIYLIGLAWELF